WIAREDERTGEDRERSGDGERCRPLSEDRDGTCRREKRTGRPRERVDHREIAGPVARGKDEEVERLENDRHSDEDERDGRENGPGHEDDGEGERRVYRGVSHVREPHERPVSTSAHGHEVPDRLDDRRNEAE